jgi:SAM-dependent methyltransferase
LRNYLEHRDLGRYLARVRDQRPIKKAVEFGCGFGRLEMLLSEYATDVTGFEREPDLVEAARTLLGAQPSIHVVQVDDLAHVPCPDAETDLSVTFTVLMHLTDAKAKAVIAELKRVTAPGGYALLCEQTDAADQFGDTSSDQALLARGRDISVYESWMAPFELVTSSPRVVEPTYRMANTGSYLLFRKPERV